MYRAQGYKEDSGRPERMLSQCQRQFVLAVRMGRWMRCGCWCRCAMCARLGMRVCSRACMMSRAVVMLMCSMLHVACPLRPSPSPSPSPSPPFLCRMRCTKVSTVYSAPSINRSYNKPSIYSVPNGNQSSHHMTPSIIIIREIYMYGGTRGRRMHGWMDAWRVHVHV